MSSRRSEKYLRDYADPLAVRLVAELLACDAIADRLRVARHAIAIPAFAEGDRLAQMLLTIPNDRTVAVVVANRPPDASPRQLQLDHAMKRAIDAQFPLISRLSEGLVYALGSGLLIVLDTVIRRRDGVGKARKIGMDVLLGLRHGGVPLERWLHMSDADVTLDGDYFNVPSTTDPAGLGTQPAALIHPWVHRADSDQNQEATWRYEARMLHHEAGLKWARSPFAFVTIGSTIAVDADAYAAVRGVPRREAAEDFYLLSKLAKIGAVVRGGGLVTVDGRVSDRVPFGTGAALQLAVEGPQPRCYHPTIFDWLKSVLSATTGMATGDELRLPELDDPRFEAGISARKWREDAAKVCLRESTPARRLQRLHEHFDAFATLKLMHAWRGLGLADVTVEDAAARSPWWQPPPRIAARLAATS